jgi:hypothetical protein
MMKILGWCGRRMDTSPFLSKKTLSPVPIMAGQDWRAYHYRLALIHSMTTFCDYHDDYIV